MRARAAAAGVALLALGSGVAAWCGSATRYDAAVDALAAELRADPDNERLEARVAAVLRALPEDPWPPVRERLDAAGLVPVRVPGLYWRAHPESGAGLDVVEQWLARPVARVETDQIGTIESNAALVRDVLRDGRRWLVVSASKGSADVREALAGEPTLAPRVAGWVDLVGVLEGTPLATLTADVDLEPPLPEATRRSLAAGGSRGAFPDGVRALHVAAFPHIGDVSARARRAFALLRALGPTDGYVMLDVYRRAPGRVLVVPGADHFLRVEAMGRRVAALLHVLLDEVLAAKGATKESFSPAAETLR